MTNVPVLEPIPTPASTDTQEVEQQQCEACEHLAADHDSISTRFCRATESQALTRNCICPKAARRP